MKVILILILFVRLTPVTTATEKNFTGEEDIYWYSFMKDFNRLKTIFIHDNG